MRSPVVSVKIAAFCGNTDVADQSYRNWPPMRWIAGRLWENAKRIILRLDGQGKVNFNRFAENLFGSSARGNHRSPGGGTIVPQYAIRSGKEESGCPGELTSPRSPAPHPDGKGNYLPGGPGASRSTGPINPLTTIATSYRKSSASAVP